MVGQRAPKGVLLPPFTPNSRICPLKSSAGTKTSIIMKSNALIVYFCLLLATLGCSKLERNSAFYYYFNEKVYLDERKDMIFIQFEKGLPEGQKQAVVQSEASLKPWTYQSRMGGNITYDGSGQGDMAVLQSSGRISQSTLNSFRGKEGVLSASYMFEKDGRFSAITNELIVKLNKASDYSILEEMAAKYGCRISDRDLSMENVYVLERTKSCKYETLELSHLFHESGLFYLVDPNFVVFGVLDV